MHLICSLKTGGAERLLIDLFRAAAAAGQPMIAVILNAAYDPRLVEELRSTGSPVYLIERRPGDKSPAFLAKLAHLIKQHDVRLIHAHDLGSKVWAAVLRLRFIRLKTVFTMHNTGIANRYSKWHRRFHNAMVSETIAISDAVRQESKDSGIAHVALIHNGIDVSRFRAAIKPAAPRQRLVIINVARYLHSQKGQDVLIRAVRQCVDQGLDVECQLVGTVAADPGSIVYLRNLVGELGLEDHVTFLVDRLDIPELLKAADIFVLPSRFEGFGLALIEAMAAGVPVIATNTGGPAELIDNGANGILVTVESEVELAQAIRHLAENEGLRESIAQEALKTAERYDIQTMQRLYQDLYRRLAA
jgi:glycosyltransferase involved in cell wall biosynthesis